MTTTFAKSELRPLLNKFNKGLITKAEAERTLGIKNARGKAITRLWASTYGVDTRNGKVTPLI